MTCQHTSRWYPREICWCGNGHAFCEGCGAQVDKHQEARQ